MRSFLKIRPRAVYALYFGADFKKGRFSVVGSCFAEGFGPFPRQVETRPFWLPCSSLFARGFPSAGRGSRAVCFGGAPLSAWSWRWRRRSDRRAVALVSGRRFGLSVGSCLRSARGLFVCFPVEGSRAPFFAGFPARRLLCCYSPPRRHGRLAAMQL